MLSGCKFIDLIRVEAEIQPKTLRHQNMLQLFIILEMPEHKYIKYTQRLCVLIVNHLWLKQMTNHLITFYFCP